METIINQLSSTNSCEICGSFNESSIASFGQSHSSSKVNYSTSSSWVSQSSCDCISPCYPVLPASHFMFHNHSILPPLLSSSARMEMQVYKQRAIEKERKRRQKKSNHLMSKVDSVVAGDDSEISCLNIQLVETETIDEVTVEKVDISCDKTDENDKLLISPLDLVDPEILKDTKLESPSKPSNADSGVVDESSFQENAYRNSLQNLLHKSITMNESSNTSGFADKMAEKGLFDKSKECGDANIALANTLAVDTELIIVESDHLSSVNTSSEEERETSSIAKDKRLDTEINKVAEDIVDSVLKSVRLELVHKTTAQSPNKDSISQALQTSEESPLKSCSIQCPYFSPRPQKSLSASPCKATEQIDRAIHLLENQFLLHLWPQKSSSQDCSSSVPPLESKTSFLSPEILKDSGSSALFKMQRTESSVLNSSTDTTKDTETEVDGEKLQSECFQQESKDMTTPIESLSNSSSPTLLTSEDRIRRNSFSVETPSSLLLSSRLAHTIHAEEGDTTQPEVKRKLDMRSDSDESLLSSAITEISLKPFSVKERKSIPDYYELLEEQHKQEMLKLQRHHYEQLQNFKQKFLNCHVFSPHQLAYSFGDDSKENSTISYDQIDPELHRKWCKLSALAKGHLTRMLMGSLPVQTCMQTIRDTSRTILSMRNEDTSGSTNMSAIQDATLMNRLFSQLKAAMFEFHSFFFDTPTAEQMDIIKRSRDAETRSTVLKVANRNKVPRLSAATMKSLQRKKEIRKSREEQRHLSNHRKNSQNNRIRVQPKEVKSKISSIWKTGSHKKATKGSPNSKQTTSSVRSSFNEVNPHSVSRKHHRV